MTEETGLIQEDRPINQNLTVTQLLADKELILKAISGAMESGKHYGIIPGCGDKGSLFKPGAELLCMMFRLSAEPTVVDLSTTDEIRYRVMTKIVHAPSGLVVGYGVGEASTSEEKYKWRKVTCDEEYEEAPIDRRRYKFIPKVEWKKTSGGKPYPEKIVDKLTGKQIVEKLYQVRTNPADLANTVLKMADKRSLVGGTLKATAASSVFTQDLEDLTEELAAAVVAAESPKVEPKPPIQEPQRASASKETTATAESSRPTRDPVWIPMKAKREGDCENCADQVIIGQDIFWDKAASKVYHQGHFA